MDWEKETGCERESGGGGESEVESLVRHRRRSEVEREKRVGTNWRTVTMVQRMMRVVRRILSSAAQFHTTPTNIFFSLSCSFAIDVSLSAYVFKIERG